MSRLRTMYILSNELAANIAVLTSRPLPERQMSRLKGIRSDH